jgi:hypothetical protein
VLRIRGCDNQVHERLTPGRTFFLFVLLLLMASMSAFAYGKKTTEKMVDGAVWLAPPSLRGLLTAYRSNVIEGINETVGAEEKEAEADLYTKLDTEMALLPKLASKQTSFEQIAYHFGKAAALVFLLDDPFRQGDEKRIKEISSDYKEYIERKISKNMLTFDGYSSPPFEKPISAYFDKRKENFPRYKESVLYCYFPEGDKVSSQTFDDRSNAFGVAQIIISRTVSDTAKVWFEIWKSMDGDTEGTPFLKERGKIK